LALSFLTLRFLLALSFLALGFLALSFATFSFLAFGFFAARSLLAFSLAACRFSFATRSFLTLSFLALSFLAFSFAVLFGRLTVVGAAVRGLARFGGSAPFVAGVRRPVTRIVVLYSAVAVVRAIGPSMVPLGVSIAVTFSLVPGAAAVFTVALPGVLFPVAASGSVVAVILLQGEQFCHCAGRDGEYADEPDHAQRGKKAAPSTVGRDQGAVRAISFQFQSPSRVAAYE